MKHLQRINENNKSFEKLAGYSHTYNKQNIGFWDDETTDFIEKMYQFFGHVVVVDDDNYPSDDYWVAIKRQTAFWVGADYEGLSIEFIRITPLDIVSMTRDMSSDSIEIYKMEDDYFIAEFSDASGVSHRAIQYKCDEMSGVYECIKYIYKEFIMQSVKSNIKLCESYVKIQSEVINNITNSK